MLRFYYERSKLENLSRPKILFIMDFRTHQPQLPPSIYLVMMYVLFNKPIESFREDKVKKSYVQSNECRQSYNECSVYHRLLIGWPRNMLQFCNRILQIVDKLTHTNVISKIKTPLRAISYNNTLYLQSVNKAMNNNKTATKAAVLLISQKKILSNFVRNINLCCNGILSCWNFCCSAHCHISTF